METKEIARAIKENLIAEIELRDTLTAREKRYWNHAFEVGKDHPDLAKHFLERAQEAEMKASNHNDNVRHFRYALGELLRALAIDFDTFHPELAEF